MIRLIAEFTIAAGILLLPFYGSWIYFAVTGHPLQF